MTGKTNSFVFAPFRMHRWFRRVLSQWIGTLLMLIPMLAGSCGAADDPAETAWSDRIRVLVDQGQSGQAAAVVEEWIRTYPGDVDARAWRARLNAWNNRWKESESEYRELILQSPLDVDLLSGLADVLVWQKQYEEALSFLERAMDIDPGRTDVQLRRAQALRSLGRYNEARSVYREILKNDPSSMEARRGLERDTGADNHELRINSDVDMLSYADNAASFNLEMRSHWNRRLSTAGSLQQHNRFGERAVGGSAAATLHMGPRDALTVGGSVAEDNGIVPRTQAEFEYSHGFHLSNQGFLRGIEALYRQRWLWYRNARLLVLSPGVIFYLPNDWYWSIQIYSSRMAAAGNAPEWRPSGASRLSFPIRNGISGYVHFSAGVESFEYAEQIGQYSMRSWGGGVKFRIRGGQEISGYGHYRHYDDERSAAGLGVGYAFHF